MGKSLSKQKLSIIIVGLDNSGKTTLLEYLKKGRPSSDAAEIVPTVGFQVDTFKSQGLHFTAFDMSGAGKYRPLWESYYRDCGAIIFVIDSADSLRMAVVKDELDAMLEHRDMPRGIPILFFANKKDLPMSLPPQDCAKSLRLDSITNRPWQIWHCNALSGEGVDTGFTWLADAVKKAPKK